MKLSDIKSAGHIRLEEVHIKHYLSTELEIPLPNIKTTKIVQKDKRGRRGGTRSLSFWKLKVLIFYPIFQLPWPPFGPHLHQLIAPRRNCFRQSEYLPLKMKSEHIVGIWYSEYVPFFLILLNSTETCWGRMIMVRLSVLKWFVYASRQTDTIVTGHTLRHIDGYWCFLHVPGHVEMGWEHGTPRRYLDSWIDFLFVRQQPGYPFYSDRE